MPWPLFKRKKGSFDKRVVVLLTHNQLILMAGSQQGLLACQDYECTDLESIPPLLNAFCTEHAISNASGTVLVDPASYQLLLVEAPPVEADELAGALRWKVKDLIPGSLEENIVDGFLLPEDAFRGRQKMAYAMAVKQQVISDLVDTVQEADIHVDEVSIAELALLSLLGDRHAGHVTMMINLGVEKSFLSIVTDGALYLNRKLETSSTNMQLKSVENFADEGFVDNFILELQRSRDYFESQMGKGIISHIVMLPFGGDAKGLHEIMANRLGVSVSELEIQDESITQNNKMQAEKIAMSGVLHLNRSLSGNVSGSK